MEYTSGRLMPYKLPKQAAFRELEEETGVMPSGMVLIAKFETSA